MQVSATLPANGHASTSTNGSIPNGTHEIPPIRLEHLPPFQRTDINALKQDLHNVLGDRGLPYWKALNGYLLGQIGRDELVSMVQRWFKGPQVELHNRLLQALLYNASAPTLSAQSPALSNLHKRRRLGPNDPEFDTDDTRIEPKARVHSWVMGLTGKERMRVRRAVIGRGEEEEGEDGEEGDEKKRKLTAFTPTTSMPPIAYSDGALPSSHQLSLRLSQLAKAYDLTIAPDATSEIGEFLAVGMDSHVADVITSLVRMTGQNRRGVDTIHIPTPHPSENVNAQVDHPQTPKAATIKEENDLPKPDLNTMKYLFNLVPELHTQASPSVYKLLSSLSKDDTDIKTESLAPMGLDGTPARNGQATQMSPVKSTLGLSGGSTADMRKERLTNSELLKIDHGKMDGDGKKHQKHNLHWKYEDPAVIFQDLLG